MRLALEFAALVVAAWCVMAVTHEAGHLIGGWLSGAKLHRCELRPWRVPYSLHSTDPYPLVTLWAGPILGSVIPYGVSRFVRHNAVRFIASFCVLGNGLYLALAWLSNDRFLDTARLQAAGASTVSLAFYCGVTVSFGYVTFRAACLNHFRRGTAGSDTAP